MRHLVVGLTLLVGLAGVSRAQAPADRAQAQVPAQAAPGQAPAPAPGQAAPGQVPAPTPAPTDDAMWRNFRGRITFSDVALAPASNFPSSEVMTAALRRIARSSIDEGGGFWRIHMVAFLDHPAATDLLVMRARDINVPREARDVRVAEPRQVRVFQVPIERGAREVRLDDFVLTEAMGFQRNGSYEFSIEAPPEEGSALTETKKAGKADLYAKGVITLR